MIGNILWCALTNIGRRRFGSILSFGTAFLVGGILFLGNIARSVLGFPALSDAKRLFLVLAFAALAICILLLAALAFFLTRTRGDELAIYRIHGAQRIDILILGAVETSIVSFTGSLGGVVFILLLILGHALALPSFFLGMRSLNLLKLIGIGGQAAFGVAVIAVIIGALLTASTLKRDADGLLKGAP